MSENSISEQGGCTCGHTRYEVVATPMIVHCCHCSLCQKQTGTAFALNALVESNHVTLISGEVDALSVESPSGKGQTIARCSKCHVALWSNYYMGGLQHRIRFIRVGTLDNPEVMPPDVHIFTSTKQSWLGLPDGAKVYETFYTYEDVWSEKNFERRVALFKAAGISPP